MDELLRDELARYSRQSRHDPARERLDEHAEDGASDVPLWDDALAGNRPLLDGIDRPRD